MRALRRVRARADDPTTPSWCAILAGTHALVPWLDAEDVSFADLPVEVEGLPVETLLASHPFPEVTPWSSPAMSDGSSSTRRG